MAVDGQGHVYVADQGNHRIQKFDSSGNYLGQWGSGGLGNGQFNFLGYVMIGIAVDAQGYVYVADQGNHRIQKFDSTGGYLGQWGSSGSGNGQFQYPVGVAVDGQGHVYVVDSSNSGRLQKFTSSGTFLASYAPANEGFYAPVGVALDNRGDIYVTFADNCRVFCYYPPENAIAPILHLLLD